jgi:acetyl-CoA C-acetyltransferase
MALHAIRAGEGDVFVSAGVESVSAHKRWAEGGLQNTENPVFADAARRTGQRFADGVAWSDPEAEGELPDVYMSMGDTAENIADLRDISRREQDEFAVRSHTRAQMANANGFWDMDITPVTLADGTEVVADDGPRRGLSLEKLARLRPAFRPGGTVTAGNCCAVNDGAAALIIMADRKAAQLGITPLARIVSTGVTALSPEIMGLGPVAASQQALRRAGMTIDDIDLVEINEAFAAQVIPSARDLKIDFEQLNVNGGAIALGHPYGMTGARITTTLINSLKFHDREVGLETMCVGGGQGMAMIIERLS